MLLPGSEPSLGRLVDKAGEHVSSDVLMIKSNGGDPHLFSPF